MGTDGTNIFVEAAICDGSRTMPDIRPVFQVGTTAAAIDSYMQVVANNAPVLAADVAALVNKTYTQA